MGARQKRIQLRSDKTGSEFAICISDAQGAILASTNPKASYVRAVEEVEYVEGQKYEWDFMLEKWVESIRNGWHQPQPLLPMQPESPFSQRRQAPWPTRLPPQRLRLPKTRMMTPVAMRGTKREGKRGAGGQT